MMQSQLVDHFFVVGHRGVTIKHPDCIPGTFEEKEFEAEADFHPLDRRFVPHVLCHYPLIGTESGSFPSGLQMFCFPNGIQLHHGTPPFPLWHAFVITDQYGVKSYGVCLTFYELIQPHLLEELKEINQSWQFDVSKLRVHEAYFVSNLREKMQHENSQQEEALKKLSEAQSESDKKFYTQQAKDFEEKAKVYRQMLSNYERQVELTDDVYMPKSIGILSKYPFFNFFRDYLCAVWIKLKPGLKLPIERYIVNFVREIPLPPKGKIEVQIQLDEYTFYCSRPPVNRNPIIKNFSFYPLFRCLESENIVSVVESILAEKKILFISKAIANLALATETFLSLLFPFNWHYIYIPVLPLALMGYIHAPVPYIIGMQTSYLETNIEPPPSDVVVINLDSGTVKNQNPAPLFPPRNRMKLLARLEEGFSMRLPKGTYIPPLNSALPNGNFISVSSTSCKQSKNPQEPQTPSSPLNQTPQSSQNSIPSSPRSYQDTNKSFETIEENPTTNPFEEKSSETNQETDNPFEDKEKIRSQTFNTVETKPRSQTQLQPNDKKVPHRSLSIRVPKTEKISQNSFQLIQNTFKKGTSAPKIQFFSSDAPRHDDPKSDDESSSSDSEKEIQEKDQKDPKMKKEKPKKEKYFSEEKIQEAFLRNFSSLFLSYRKYMKSPSEDEWTGNAKLEIFRTKDFINASEKERKAFLTNFLETQAFSQFILDRIVRDQNDPEILFFDEAIKTKKNRSIFTRNKEYTPFLDDHENYCISETFKALTPNESDIKDGSLFKYETFPVQLSKEYLINPRPIEALDTSTFNIELTAHTSAITRKARLEKMQKMEKRSWILSPQTSIKKIKQERNFISDEERSLMFDMILEQVFLEVQSHTIPPDELPKKSIEEIEECRKVMYRQQEVLISAADDDHLVERNNMGDLQSALQSIITKIAVYQDHLNERRKNES